MVSGFAAFALFCFTLAVSLRPLGTAAAFALATTLALLMQATALVLLRGEPAPEPVPEY
jgi:hypothetical protein